MSELAALSSGQLSLAERSRLAELEVLGLVEGVDGAWRLTERAERLYGAALRSLPWGAA